MTPSGLRIASAATATSPACALARAGEADPSLQQKVINGVLQPLKGLTTARITISTISTAGTSLMIR